MLQADALVGSRSEYTSWVLIALLVATLAALRLSGPPDLMNFAQQPPAAYTLDILHNGHWICQCDDKGEITSKPPLYTWLAALTAQMFERPNRFSLSFPAIASTALLSILVFEVGRRRFGWAAGWLAVTTYITTPTAAKQVALVRTDALFALMVALTALAAWQAWTTGRGWTWFWLAAAGATLTKGPLGLLLGAAGLGAVFWEKRTGHPTSLRGSHWTGVVVYLGLTVGWFALAWWQMGRPLIDKMFGQELVGNAIYAHDTTVFPGRWFYKPPLYFLAQFAPWSVIACVDFWRIWRWPAADDTERRLERFLFCWIWVGMIPFCLGASQRNDHLMPLMPAVAVLVGREMALWRWLKARRRVIALVAVSILLGFMAGAFYQWATSQDNPYVSRTKQVQAMARWLEMAGAADLPLSHVDSPFALQFYLNTMRPTVSFERAAKMLAGDATVFVAVHDLARLKKSFAGRWDALYEVARSSSADDAWVAIISNHPRLEWTPRMAVAVGPFTVRMQGVRLVDTRGNQFVFASRDQAATPHRIAITNESKTAQSVRIQWQEQAARTVQDRHLAPGETWELGAR